MNHPVPELPVRDILESQEYYQDVFNCEINWRYKDILGAVSNLDLVLFFRKCESKFESRTLWIFDEQVEETFSKLPQSKIEVVEPIEQKPWGLRQFTVRDLNGHDLIFHCD